jgi:RNA polymerase-binding transcription factor DksA
MHKKASPGRDRCAPMAPGLMAEFAEILHERRSELGRGRELRRIDDALGRIRAGSYGTCAECGRAIQYLHLFIEPTARRCLTCPSRSRATGS